MRITEITVSAGRVFNHHYESYSNLRPQVTLRAVVDGDEDPIAATKQLQAQAEQLVEDHKNHLLRSLRDLHELTEAEAEIERLAPKIEAMQGALDRARKYVDERRQALIPESA